MSKMASLVAGAALVLASAGFAYADDSVAGAWKMTVGVNGAPCSLTFTANESGTSGAIAAGPDCPSGLNAVSTWKMSGASMELYAGSGDLVAWLKPKDGVYLGTRLSDGRKLALSR
jgi:hypothetical protein